MIDMASAPSSIAVLTSGGDAGGMNAAVRAVVRTALSHGLDAFVIHDGFQGLVDGGEAIRRVESADVGRILHRGGTVFGTAVQRVPHPGGPAQGCPQPAGTPDRRAGRDRRRRQPDRC